MVWSRLWVFWSSGCTMVSLPLTFGGKRSLSSPQRRPCSFTMDTPSFRGRHFAYSQTQQKMWLLCVFNDKKQCHGKEGNAFAKSWSVERSDELNSPSSILMKKSLLSRLNGKMNGNECCPEGIFLLVQKFILCWDLL